MQDAMMRLYSNDIANEKAWSEGLPYLSKNLKVGLRESEDDTCLSLLGRLLADRLPKESNAVELKTPKRQDSPERSVLLWFLVSVETSGFDLFLLV